MGCQISSFNHLKISEKNIRLAKCYLLLISIIFLTSNVFVTTKNPTKPWIYKSCFHKFKALQNVFLKYCYCYKVVFLRILINIESSISCNTAKKHIKNTWKQDLLIRSFVFLMSRTGQSLCSLKEFQIIDKVSGGQIHKNCREIYSQLSSKLHSC